MEGIFASLNGFTQFSTLLISLIALLFHIRWSRRATALGPTILTTLGRARDGQLLVGHMVPAALSHPLQTRV